MLALILSPVGRYAAIALAVLALLGGAAWWHAAKIESHDLALETKWAQAQKDAVDAAVAEERKRGAVAVLAAQTAAKARADSLEATLETISHAPLSTVCTDTGLARTVIDGLYGPAAGPGTRAAKPAR